jgi:hypothetical protein
MRIVRGERSGPPGRPPELLVTAGGYVVLLALGVLEGLIGSFQYSRAAGPVPVAAVAFALLIGVTIVLGAWGMHRPMGGLLPAVGWFVASFVLAMGTSGGSVLITNTSAGQWFLYGGAVCALAGVIAGFLLWSPRRLPRPGTDAWQREIPPGTRRGSDAYPSDRTGPARQVDARNADSGQPDP